MTSKNIVIGELETTETDAALLKKFRHEAVAENPPVLTTIENEETHDVAFYQRLLEKSKKRDGMLILFALDKGEDGKDKKIVGMVGAKFDCKTLSGDAHSATLLGMFVNKDYRRMGIGRKLVNTLISMLKPLQIHHYKAEVVLASESVQKEVLQFYVDIGFYSIGTGRQDVFWRGKYYNVVYLRLY